MLRHLGRVVGERCDVLRRFAFLQRDVLPVQFPHGRAQRLLFDESRSFKLVFVAEVTKVATDEEIRSLGDPLHTIGDQRRRGIYPLDLFHRVLAQMHGSFLIRKESHQICRRCEAERSLI